MRLLITGSTGFVGRNLLLRALNDNRYDSILLPVRNVEKLKEQMRQEGYTEIPKKVIPIVSSAPHWAGQGFDESHHVIHSAGVLFARNREEYFHTNVDGTVGLMNCLHPQAKVVILSSLSAAGPCLPGKEFRRETDSEDPLTWYGQSKLEMEKRLRVECRDRQYIILRPPLIFGPRDTTSLPLFKMVQKKFHFKPGIKAKYYSYLHVDDLVEGIFLALFVKKAWESSNHRHFFVASSNPISDEELILTAAEVCAKNGILIRLPQGLLKVISKIVDAVPTWRTSIPSLTADRAKEIWPERWVASPEEFSRAFNWEAKATLLSTLKDTHHWYQKSGQLNASHFL